MDGTTRHAFNACSFDLGIFLKLSSWVCFFLAILINFRWPFLPMALWLVFKDSLWTFSMCFGKKVIMRKSSRVICFPTCNLISVVMIGRKRGCKMVYNILCLMVPGHREDNNHSAEILKLLTIQHLYKFIF